jgi:hypothetical protein
VVGEYPCDGRVGEWQWARCGVVRMTRWRVREGWGYYTLCMMLASWEVQALVVGYDVAFLEEGGMASGFNSGGAPEGGHEQRHLSQSDSSFSS